MINIRKYTTVILLALAALILAPLTAPVVVSAADPAPTKPVAHIGIVDYEKVAPRKTDGSLLGTLDPIYAIVNKSGTTERNGVVQVRLDLCLAPGAYRYDDARFYVVDTSSAAYLAGYTGKVDKDGIPIDAADYDKWHDGLPRVWAEHRVFHTHFIYLDPYDFTEDAIQAAMAYHLPNFYAAWCLDLDQELHGMRHGWAVESRIRPPRYDNAFRTQYCQSITDGIAPITFDSRGTGEGKTFPATEIDVGSAATDRSSHTSISLEGPFYTTAIDYNNPANATGVIDTVESYYYYADENSNVVVGSFSDDGEGVFTCRDAQEIGVVATGYNSHSGLDLDINTGDYIGCVGTTAYTVRIDRASSGFAGIYTVNGNYCTPTASTTYGLGAGDAISLYGTGETASITTPSIDTVAATSISNSTARLNAYVSNDGNETCDVRFQYGTATGNYTDATAWVNDTYSTGDYPYADIDNLTSGTEYFYRAVIANSAGQSEGNETSFTTASGVNEPTGFKAIASGNDISLSWTKGAGSTSTLVRGKIGSYPTSTTDGTFIYSGVSVTARHNNLAVGTTYYYSAWGISGGVYSDNATHAYITTGFPVSETDIPASPDIPNTWWSGIDITKLSQLPLYAEVNTLIDDYGVAQATGWTFLIVSVVLILAAGAFVATDGNVVVTGLATGTMLTGLSLLRLLPLWMMGLGIIIFISIGIMRERV